MRKLSQRFELIDFITTKFCKIIFIRLVVKTMQKISDNSCCKYRKFNSVNKIYYIKNNPY